MLIKDIDNQYKEVCLEAVKQNGEALEYVKEQTPEICIAAVKQNGDALQYVKEQTKEICLEAVKQNGYAISKQIKVVIPPIKNDFKIQGNIPIYIPRIKFFLTYVGQK